jgi:ribonuclease VapC
VIEPDTEEQAHLARQAHFDFGKGRHPAGLNFGDYFVYARLPRRRASKGDDFARTDIAPGA